MKTWVQRAYAPLRSWLPSPVANSLRSITTAAFGPSWNAYRLGHTRSSFARKAMDRSGKPVPWYTYPCIQFLEIQNFEGQRILEFGAGQSTLWWSERAESVVAFEEDDAWAFKAPNITIHKLDQLPSVRGPFDIVIVDGFKRYRVAREGLSRLSETGAIICDNSEGYGIFQALQGEGLQRVDFYGMAPGVVLPHCTSIFFRPGCRLFSNSQPIAKAC